MARNARIFLYGEWNQIFYKTKIQYVAYHFVGIQILIFQ